METIRWKRCSILSVLKCFDNWKSSKHRQGRNHGVALSPDEAIVVQGDINPSDLLSMRLLSSLFVFHLRENLSIDSCDKRARGCASVSQFSAEESKIKYTAFWNGLETIIMTSVQWVIGRVVQKIMEAPAFLLC